MTDTRTHNTTLPTHKRLDALEAAVKVQGQDLTVAIAELTERLDNHTRQIDAMEDDASDRLAVLERTVSGLLLVVGQQEREAEAQAHNASIDDDLLPCGCAREAEAPIPPTPGTYVRTDDDHLHLISVMISTAGGETTRETAGRILRYMRESGADVRRVERAITAAQWPEIPEGWGLIHLGTPAAPDLRDYGPDEDYECLIQRTTSPWEEIEAYGPTPQAALQAAIDQIGGTDE